LAGIERGISRGGSEESETGPLLPAAQTKTTSKKREIWTVPRVKGNDFKPPNRNRSPRSLQRSPPRGPARKKNQSFGPFDGKKGEKSRDRGKEKGSVIESRALS